MEEPSCNMVGMLAHAMPAFLALLEIYIKTLSGEECEEHDKKILGIFALAWNLFTTTLPKEIVIPTCDAIAEAGLPVMTAQGNTKGQLILFK